MASPEEMLEHPANDLVRTFMGKHTPDTAPSKVESFMRTNVFSVRKDRGVLECAERMARGSVDTLLVTDEQNRYLGTISIGLPMNMLFELPELQMLNVACNQKIKGDVLLDLSLIHI